MVRVGLIARADNRGLGIESWEFHRHLAPAKTLIVDLSSNSPYDLHPERFDSDAVVVAAEDLGPDTVGPFLDGLDVVWTFETPYWWGPPVFGPEPGLLEQARSQGVATVVRVNPEFFAWATDPERPQPDLFVAPTRWRLPEMQEIAPVRYLPYPVARDRVLYRYRPDSTPPTFLHIAGHPAIHDRNGTLALVQALRLTRQPMRVLIRAQTDLRLRISRLPRTVDLHVETGDVENYWQLYEDGDVLVLPRRFGGQSLPINEALSAGLPVVATDLDPQNRWLPPETLVRTRLHRSFATQGGRIQIGDVDTRRLAATLDRLATNPDEISKLSLAADRLAAKISWERLLPDYRNLLEEVAAR